MPPSPAAVVATPPAYADLLARLREVALLESVGSVLGWDERTQMPPAATPLRAEQAALVARLAHERRTDPALGEAIAAVEASPDAADPDSEVAAVVREARRDFDRATKLPASLVEAIQRQATLGEHAWERARADDDFPAFAPHLSAMLDLKRQEAACLGTGPSDYDALLDQYEPDATAATVAAVFDALRPRLVDLVRRVADARRGPREDVLTRHYPAAAQASLARTAAASVGYDFLAGRLDTTVHPFATGIGPGDSRITTRYDEHYFSDGFFGTLHEAGHAMYEQGLPKSEEHFGSPLAEAASLGVHESQSRLWENLVGRSRPFWRHVFPLARAAFPSALGDVGEGEFVGAANAVRPSLIRVEADEATYNLHVMLRFDLERALLSGDLPVADLPAAWADACDDYLGVRPATDREGCLQDVHWSFGAVGYFPTYALGNLYAAQLFEAIRRDLGDVDACCPPATSPRCSAGCGRTSTATAAGTARSA